jgi:hypothetical protein
VRPVRVSVDLRVRVEATIAFSFWRRFGGYPAASLHALSLHPLHHHVNIFYQNLHSLPTSATLATENGGVTWE